MTPVADAARCLITFTLSVEQHNLLRTAYVPSLDAITARRRKVKGGKE